MVMVKDNQKMSKVCEYKFKKKMSRNYGLRVEL